MHLAWYPCLAATARTKSVGPTPTYVAPVTRIMRLRGKDDAEREMRLNNQLENEEWQKQYQHHIFQPIKQCICLDLERMDEMHVGFKKGNVHIVIGIPYQLIALTYMLRLHPGSIRLPKKKNADFEKHGFALS